MTFLCDKTNLIRAKNESLAASIAALRLARREYGRRGEASVPAKHKGTWICMLFSGRRKQRSMTVQFKLWGGPGL